MLSSPSQELQAGLRRAANEGKTRVKRDSPAPLSSGLWLRELRRLHARCAREASSFDDRAIRKAFHLAKLSPRPLRPLLVPLVSEDELEALLEKGLHQVAAEMVTRQHVNLAQHAPRSGRYSATMQMDSYRKVEFEGASKALAIIGAWSGFLTEMRQSRAATGS